MSSICILTDSSVQFTQPSFQGRNLVHIIPLDITIAGNSLSPEKPIRINELPAYVDDEHKPHLSAPGVDFFSHLFVELGNSYSSVLALFSSYELTKTIDNALSAYHTLHARAPITFIDTKSISIGLGFIVQSAAEAINAGKTLPDVERLVRSIIPKIYAVFCAPSFSYLRYSGFIDDAQAIIGEMLGLHPIFALEDGKLTPLQKLRNHKQVFDYFQEFLDEFDQLTHISLLQSMSLGSNESRLLREHAQANYPGTPFTEHPINLPLASLFGPTVQGIFVIE